MKFNRKQIVNLQSKNTKTKAETKFHEISINILKRKNFSFKKREESIPGS